MPEDDLPEAEFERGDLIVGVRGSNAQYGLYYGRITSVHLHEDPPVLYEVQPLAAWPINTTEVETYHTVKKDDVVIREDEAVAADASVTGLIDTLQTLHDTVSTIKEKLGHAIECNR